MCLKHSAHVQFQRTMNNELGGIFELLDSDLSTESKCDVHTFKYYWRQILYPYGPETI